jgi:hypothetical protein
MIISTDTENVFEKIQQYFMINAINNPRIEGTMYQIMAPLKFIH